MTRTKMPGLKERVAAETPQNSYPPPPPKEETVAPTIEELRMPNKERLELQQAILESYQWASQEREAKKARAPLTEYIKKMLGHYGIGRVQCEGVPVSYYNAPRTKLDQKKLMRDFGVTQEMIDACTVTTDCYTLRIGGGREDE